jgi:signal peptidase I
MRKLSQEEYLEKAVNTHGDKYDLSCVEFKNMRSEITVKCRIHGIFHKNAKSFIYGYECNKCSGKEMSFEDFMIRAKSIHENKYTYDKDSFRSTSKAITIKCPEHGEFRQIVAGHLVGRGCPNCAKNKKIDTEEFIKRSKKLHGDKYRYDLVRYYKKDISVEIVCPDHGPFFIIPNNHIFNKQGCPICSGKNHNTESFIDSAIKFHGDKYNYTQVKYTGNDRPVDIICKKHGVFSMRARFHLSGHGCPSCHLSKGEVLVSTILKKLDIPYIKNKTFKDCLDKSLLRFDFYIAMFNSCIEYDGKQHFEFIPSMYRNFNDFLAAKRRDEIKNRYCYDKGIRLIRIPYTLKRSQIEEKLSECFT